MAFLQHSPLSLTPSHSSSPSPSSSSSSHSSFCRTAPSSPFGSSSSSSPSSSLAFCTSNFASFSIALSQQKRSERRGLRFSTKRLHPCLFSSTKARPFSHGDIKAVVAPADVGTAFEQMATGTQRRYYMLGGKGGVGKTSLAASLGVKFANSGHHTLVVSTDPAHSLSDSFSQDLTGGMPVAVEGPDFPLFVMEINPEQARAEFRAATSKDGGSGVKDFMDSMGLGGWVEQLGELKLGELLDTPPPGLDEAIAIAKVVQFIQAPEYSKFTRIVFDTAPTGHTLRLLSLPDFLDASIGKILKLKQKLSSATAAIKSVFGQSGDGQDSATEKLELLKERMLMVRDIFRNKETTEFVIVTIPTVMAINESGRLSESLHKEGVPVKRLIVNQILPPSSSDCKFCNIKRRDQQKALELLKTDPNLKNLQILESPLFDLEIRGVPALKFMGDIVWK